MKSIHPLGAVPPPPADIIEEYPVTLRGSRSVRKPWVLQLSKNEPNPRVYEHRLVWVTRALDRMRYEYSKRPDYRHSMAEDDMRTCDTISPLIQTL